MNKFLVVILGVLLFSCGEKSPEEILAEKMKDVPEEELTAEQKVQMGKAIYNTQCKLCHGDDGTLGNSGAKNLQESLLKGEDLINVISYGQNTMQPFKDILKPDDIKKVAAFVETLEK